MSHVSVTIHGRKVRMECEDGQEAHLMELAAGFDARISKLHESHGEIGEARLTIMAALTLADELAAATARLQRAEAELGAVQSARESATEGARSVQSAVSAALTTAAERIEGMARRLRETRSDNGSSVAMG